MSIFDEAGNFIIPEAAPVEQQPVASSSQEVNPDSVQFPWQRPPEWEFAPGKRLEAGLQDSVGSLWGAASAAADAVGMDTASQWAAERAGEMFQKATEHDLVNTNFRDIKNPVDAGKYFYESLIKFVPDMALMMAGGVGAETLAGKVVSKGIGSKAVETLAHKTFANNLKVLTEKAAGTLTKDELYKKAIVESAGDIGKHLGSAGVIGAQSTGGMYLGDRKENGPDNASPWSAMAAGGATGLIAMLAPVNKFLIGKTGVPTDILKTTIGQAGDMMGMEIPKMAHEAGLDPNKTFGEILMSKEGAMRLAESGITGAMIGGTFGIGGKALTGGFSSKKPAEITKEITETPETTLEQAGIDTTQDVKVGDLIQKQQEEIKGKIAEADQTVFGLNKQADEIKSLMQWRKNGLQSIQTRALDLQKKTDRIQSEISKKGSTPELSNQLRQIEQQRASLFAEQDRMRALDNQQSGITTEQLASELNKITGQINSLSKTKVTLDAEHAGLANQKSQEAMNSEIAGNLADLFLSRRIEGQRNKTDAARQDLMRYAAKQDQIRQAKNAPEVAPEIKPATPEELLNQYQPEVPGMAEQKAKEAAAQKELDHNRRVVEAEAANDIPTLPSAEPIEKRIAERQAVVGRLAEHLTDPSLFEEGTNNIKQPKDWKGPVSWVDVTPSEKKAAVAKVVAKAEAKVKENPKTLKGKQEVRKAKEIIKKAPKIVTPEAPLEPTAPKVSMIDKANTAQVMETTGPDVVDTATMIKRAQELKAKTEAEQAAILATKEGTRAAGDWQGSTMDVAGKKVKIFEKGNETIVSHHSKKHQLVVRNEEGHRESMGFFKSVKDAQTASKEGKTAEEFYPPKETEAAKRKARAMTPTEKSRVEELTKSGETEKITSGLAFRNSDFPLAEETAMEAIIDASKTYDPTKTDSKGKAVSFRTYAANRAAQAILDAKKKLGIEVQETTAGMKGEGGGESNITGASKQSIADTALIDTKKVKEVDTKADAAPLVEIDKEAYLKEKAAKEARAAEAKAAKADKVKADIKKEEVIKVTGKAGTGKQTTKTPAQISREESDKVIDSKGNPVNPPIGATIKLNKDIGRREIVSFTNTVYHGTPTEWQGDWKEGRPIFLTTDKTQAETYSSKTGKVKERKVTLKNPYVIDFQGRQWTSGPGGVGSAMSVAKRMSESGAYDGILFLNIVDPGPQEGKGYNRIPTTQVAVFKNNSLSKNLSLKQEVKGELNANGLPKFKAAKEDIKDVLESDMSPKTQAGVIADRFQEQRGGIAAGLEDLKKANLGKEFESAKEDAIYILERRLADFNTSREEFVAKYPNALSLIRGALKDSSDKVTQSLAKFLMSTVDLDKLEGIKVDMGDRNARLADNSIMLTKGSLSKTWVHEVVHTITINEMESNPALRAKVEDMLKVARREALSRGFVTKDQIKQIEKINTSNEWLKSGLNDNVRHAYGLLNTKEFLSEAFSNKKFQDLLKSIKYPSVKKQTVWNKFMQFVGEVFRVTKDPAKMNMFEAAISIVPELSAEKGTPKDFLESLSVVDTADKPLKKKTREEQRAVMIEHNKTDKPVDIVKKWGEDAIGVFKDFAQSVTERLRNISVSLITPVRKMEFGILNDNRKYQDKIKDFVDGYRKMSEGDRMMLDLTLMNREADDIVTRKELLKKNGLEGAYSKVLEVLKEIHGEKEKVGLNHYDSIADYFPRRVVDVRGLMQAIKEDPAYNVIQAELDRLGKDANQLDKEKAVKNMIATGRFPALALLEPSSSKRRTITRVSSEWKHFYDNSINTLIGHIYESNEAIHSRKLFGDIHRKELIAARDKIYGSLNNDKLSPSVRAAKVSKLMKIEDRLNDYETEITNGISQMLAEKAPNMTPKEVDETIRVIRARLTQKGMHGPMATLRNASLMSVLSSPTSAITQIGDLGFSIYKYGPSATVKAILGDKLITSKDLDLSHSMKEFQQMGSARWLEKTLKWSGLQAMDNFGKNTTMNAAILKAKGMSLKDFSTKYQEIFGKETEQTWKDIQAGKNTELVRFYAFNELSDLQPISMSEMPLQYLGAGNSRIFYALKSYNIKALNVVYRESVQAWKNAKTNGDRMKAGRDAGRLLLLLTMAGATADEIKDFVLGKEAGGFSDNVQNNILKLFFLSRYSMDQMATKGIAATLSKDLLLPPTGLIDDPLHDIVSLISGEPTLKTLKDVPWGKIPYAWMSGEYEKSDMTKVHTEILDSYKKGASYSSVQSKMNKYNAWARTEKKPLITFSTLGSARSKYKKDNK